MKRTGIKRKATRPKPGDDAGYARWLRGQRCCGCGASPLSTVIQAAHTEHLGMALKGPGRSCVPLCVSCHDLYDGRATTRISGHAEFEKAYNIDMKAQAAAHYERYLNDSAKGREI